MFLTEAYLTNARRAENDPAVTAQSRPLALVRWLAIALLALAAALPVLDLVGGRWLVQAVYDGPLTPWLGHVLEGRHWHDVDHYARVLSDRTPFVGAALGALSLGLMCLTHADRFTGTVLALDFAFLAADRGSQVVRVFPSGFSVSADGGYPEMY